MAFDLVVIIHLSDWHCLERCWDSWVMKCAIQITFIINIIIIECWYLSYTFLSMSVIVSVKTWPCGVFAWALEDDEGKNNDGISFSSQCGPAWLGTDRDYTYDEVGLLAKGIWLYWFKACPSLRLLAPSILVEPVWESLMIILWCPPQLLNRVFNIMREKNPDMVAGEKRKFVMKPPQVVRVGTKKTSFVNFTDICKLWVKHVYFIHSTDFRDLSFYILQESYSIWWLKCGSVS